MQTEQPAVYRHSMAALSLVVALLAVLGAGCSVTPPAAALQVDSGASVGADANRISAVRAHAALEARYLLFKADQTQLRGVQDDGRFTYLEFTAPVGEDLQLFDQDGRALESAHAGQVAAVQGVHAGVLVQRGDRASFASPNPRLATLPRQPFRESADHAQARASLEGLSGQLAAMQKALEAARSAVAAAKLRPASQRESGAAPVESAPRSRSGATSHSPLPEVVYAAPPRRLAKAALAGAQESPWQTPEALPLQPQPGQPSPVQLPWVRPVAAPLAAANASAAAPERGLLRVFFATASRAIVAPEDGLALLLQEAANADEIRVTGFTDATGSRATNDALALARADAVVQILLRRGIPAARIVSHAVGADEYIADNASERGRALNRRVEVLLLREGAPLQLGTHRVPGDDPGRRRY